MLIACCCGRGDETLIVFLGLEEGLFLSFGGVLFLEDFLKHCDHQNHAIVNLGSYMLIACCWGHGHEILIVFLGAFLFLWLVLGGCACQGKHAC